MDSNTTTAPTLQIRLTHNYSYSPTLLNNLNVGFLRDKGFTGPLQAGPGLAALGISGLPALATDSPYPNISIGTIQNGIGSTAASSDAENRYVLNDNVTLIRGRTHLRRVAKFAGCRGTKPEFQMARSRLNQPRRRSRNRFCRR